MTFNKEREAPEPSPPETIGSKSIADIGTRLACLIEAREQSRASDQIGFGSILYRAYHNARFVLHGEVQPLRIHEPAKPRPEDHAGDKPDA